MTTHSSADVVGMISYPFLIQFVHLFTISLLCSHIPFKTGNVCVYALALEPEGFSCLMSGDQKVTPGKNIFNS